MTDDSSLPPARVRIRPARLEGALAAPQLEVELPIADQPEGSQFKDSLMGEGPRDYLLGCEDIESFDNLDQRLNNEIAPCDPIEEMWFDEIVDFTWNMHRLKNIKKITVETKIKKKIVEMTEEKGMNDSRVWGRQTNLSRLARDYVKGAKRSDNLIVEILGPVELKDALYTAQSDVAEVLMRLDLCIIAIARQRDATIDRLYGRRELIAKGRLVASPR